MNLSIILQYAPTQAAVVCIDRGNGRRWFYMVSAVDTARLGGVYAATIDIQVHDTYFVFAGGHVEKGGAFVSGVLAVVYYSFPRVLHRPLHRGLGYWHFWLSVIGIFLFFNAAVIFMDTFVWEYFSRPTLSHSVWIEWDKVANLALLLLLPGQVVFLVNLVYSLGKKSI